MIQENQEMDTSTWEISTKVNGKEWITTKETTAIDSENTSLETILNAVFGSLVTLTTFVGQVIVITVVSRDQRLRTPSSYFFTSLALADLVISIVSMPTWTVYSAFGYWPFSQALCDIWNMVDYSICVVSIYTILFMSADRYLSLKYPLTYRIKRTATRAKVTLILIWVMTIIVYSLFIWLTQLFMAEDRDPKGCTLFYFTSVPLTLTFVTLALWTPVFGTAFFYFLVFNIAQKAGKINRTLKKAGGADNPSVTADSQKTVDLADELSIEMTSVSSASTVTVSASDAKNAGVPRAKSKRITKVEKELKAMKTIALLLITFSICWLPLSIVFVFESAKPGYLHERWMIGCYWLGYLNSMFNPVCYAVGNPYFRETLYKLCKCGRK